MSYPKPNWMVIAIRSGKVTDILKRKTIVCYLVPEQNVLCLSHCDLPCKSIWKFSTVKIVELRLLSSSL